MEQFIKPSIEVIELNEDIVCSSGEYNTKKEQGGF